MPVSALRPEQLYHPCDLGDLTFAHTGELPPLPGPLGQARAVEAIAFGIDMEHEGYNVYVSGSSGLGKRQLIDQLLKNRAKTDATPCDWCYLHNFARHHEPLALALPAGEGTALQKDMDSLVEKLMDAAPAAFKSEDYRKRVSDIQNEYQGQHERELMELAERARQNDIALLRTPHGYTLGPLHNGELIGPKEFEKLAPEQQTALQQKVELFNEELQAKLEHMPQLLEESRQRIRELNIEVARVTVAPLLAQLHLRWADNAAVCAHLNKVQDYAVDNFADFLPGEEDDSGGLKKKRNDEPRFLPYRVNVLIDNRDTKGVPVYYEENPSYQNLIGRIEHVNYYGALITNFTMIKAGAVHKANGGFLVLDVTKVLTTPFAWDALQRILQTRQIRIESLQDMLSLGSTSTLQPEAIPADFKVVLYGPRIIYYLLKQHVPQFGLLFKVYADFAEEIQRDVATTQTYAQWIASLIGEKHLQPLSRQGVCAVIEHLSRVVDDGEKVSLNTSFLCDLLCEADHVARQAGATLTEACHVQRALDQRRYRQDQWRQLSHEQIERGTILLDTKGSVVGQINALTVLDLGDYRFGRPTRITATARLGTGKVMDIERAVHLGGAIHSKGVMILEAFIAERYARNQPLALAASLVFEQSYGGIEGDSASVAELCALLSAIAQLPLAQELAITGSVNQHGQIQPIGGVNEKIEGFFEACKRRGFAPGQGVIIPATNLPHLMLTPEVIAAVKQGQFAIYAVNTVDDALELITGLTAGNRDTNGHYPADSANGKVQASIDHFSELARKLAGKNQDNDNGEAKKDDKTAPAAPTDVGR